MFSVKKDDEKWMKMFECHKSQWKSYAMSKFATAMMAMNLNKVENVTAVTVHPGKQQFALTY